MSEHARYHGVLANRSKWRSRLPAPPLRESEGHPSAVNAAAGDRRLGEQPQQKAELPANQQPAQPPDVDPEAAAAELEPTTLDAQGLHPPDGSSPARRRPLPWAQLLLRVFFVDALTCPKCSSAMKVLALISDPPVVTKILRHLRLPAEPPPVSPADPAYFEPLFVDGLASIKTDTAESQADDCPTSTTSPPTAARSPPRETGGER